MWAVIIVTVGLMFIIEGILPFLYPDGWRRIFLQAVQMSNGELRVLGFVSMLLGLSILFLAL